MNTRSFASWRGWAALAGAAALALVGACGGGSGDAVGEPSAAPADGAAAYAQGPIEGFGSIVVGGIRFDDSAARIEDAYGARWSSQALRLGHVVQVDGTALDVGAGTARALRVRLGLEVVGPVATVDRAAATMVVLGRLIEITPSTVFDESLTGGLDAIAPGLVVEVHGLPDADRTRLIATRVEAQPAVDSYRLRGVVSALDRAARTFRIGTELISYAGIDDALLPTALADGVAVGVHVQTVPVDGAWVATLLHVPSGPSITSGEARVHGVITAFTSAARFEIDGLPVDASGALFADGSAGLALGVRVEVHGVLRDGVLVARRVDAEARHGGPQRRFELRGSVQALDREHQTFRLRNVTVRYDGPVRFRDGTAADLADGRRVEVKGVVSRDRTQLQAVEIDFR